MSELTEHKLTTDPMENLKCLIAWRDKGIILSTRRTVVNSHGDYGENLIATQTTSPTHAAGQNYFFLHFLSLRLHPLFVCFLSHIINNPSLPRCQTDPFTLHRQAEAKTVGGMLTNQNMFSTLISQKQNISLFPKTSRTQSRTEVFCRPILLH